MHTPITHTCTCTQRTCTQRARTCAYTRTQAYCTRSAGNKRRLAGCVVGGAHRALSISVGGRKTAAPVLLKLAQQLLQLPLMAGAGARARVCRACVRVFMCVRA